MVHGVRKHVARGANCPAGKGMAFTQWDAAEAARIRLGAERVYDCSACGYLHITRYTEGEYSQRIADQGCTPDVEYGIVVDTDEGENDEEQTTSDRGQPPPRRRDAGKASQQRGWDPRLTPSPAALARILARSSDQGGELT